MGMGDCSKSVTPKFGLLAKARDGGTSPRATSCRGLTHPTMAVTGSQCLASCALTPGTVADGLLDRPSKGPAMVTLEHPMGLMEVLIDFELARGQFRSQIRRACANVPQSGGW